MTATITDNDRVIWTGPLAVFLVDNADGLDIDEAMALAAMHAGDSMYIGGGAAPLLRITVEG